MKKIRKSILILIVAMLLAFGLGIYGCSKPEEPNDDDPSTPSTNVTTVTDNVDLFIIKQTNEAGEIVVNDYTYTLTDASVKSVVLDGVTLTADDYSVAESVITVKGESFVNAASNTQKTLTITSDTTINSINFGKIASFAVTKASDINSVTPNTLSPMILATCEDSTVDAVKWGGYIIVTQDIDFDGATFNTKCLSANKYGRTGGFVGRFDGQNHTLKNLNMWVESNSLFGYVANEAIIENTNFIDFRFNRYNVLGLFDYCYGTVQNVTVDGTSDRDGCTLLGNFQTETVDDELVGGKLLNSTIYARVGYATETSESCVMSSSSTFVSTEGTTIHTQYNVPESFTAVGGVVEKLNAGAYHALKVNDPNNDVGSGGVVDNDFVKTGLEGTLESVTLYGASKDFEESSVITGATLSDGTLTIPVSSLNSHLGRGIAIRVKTDSNTYWYYQDIVTYAISSAADVYASDIVNGADNQHGYLPRFAKAGGATTGYDTQAVTSNYTGYFILANDVDFDGAAIISSIQVQRTSGNWDFGLVGTIDGRGYSFKNFVLDARDWGWHTMLGTITKDGTVKNVGFVNYTLNGGYNAGLFISTGKVDNVYIDCTRGTNGYTLVGYVQYGAAIPTFTNSTVIVRGAANDGNPKIFGDLAGETDFTNTVIYTDLSSTIIGGNITGGTVKSLSELA